MIRLFFMARFGCNPIEDVYLLPWSGSAAGGGSPPFYLPRSTLSATGGKMATIRESRDKE
jgi:hypothetical protein